MFVKRSGQGSVEINKMIKEITTGSLGTILKNKQYELCDGYNIDMICSYSNDMLTIYYNQKGFNSKYNTMHFSYDVYYNGELAYECKDDYISVFKKGSRWYNELKTIYLEHLTVVKNQQNHYQQEAERLKKSLKILKVFGLVGHEGYIDDKIIIDETEHRTIPAPDWSNSKDEEIFNGRISLIDGTVVKDTRKGIHRPGKWEDYVCDLIDMLELKRKYEQQLKKENYDNQQRQKKLEKQRRYELNHSPIDDSKYFK